MPLSDVFGRTGTDPPVQIFWLVPKGKTGGTTGFTVTVILVCVAHCPAVGVKV